MEIQYIIYKELGLRQITVENIVPLLNDLNEAYRNGLPKVTDECFDALEDTLRIADPTNPYFDKIGLTPNIQKVALPVRMGSMHKVNTVEEIYAWFKHKKIPLDTVLCLTPKLDGCSLLVNEESYNEAFTRGDGHFGQSVGKAFNLTNSNFSPNPHYSYGEAIMKRVTFEKKYSKSVLGEKEGYSNPRNLVPGQFNPLSEPNESILSDIDYIRYGIEPFEGGLEYSKDYQIILCNKKNINQIPYKLVNIQDLTEEFLNELYVKWSIDYELDGIIVDINEFDLRKELGRETNGNPAYARAYKGNFEEVKETEIIRLDWQIGRTGQVTPVAYFKSTNLEGGNVKKASLYNAKYLMQNKIGVGCKVLLKRSGGVIPKIVKILTIDPYCPNYEKMCSFEKVAVRSDSSGLLECKWDETKTNIFLINSNDEQKLQQLEHFFKTVGVDNFGYPTIKKIYEAGYETVGDILQMNLVEFIDIDGIGLSTAENLKSQFKIIKEVSFAKLADASCCFDGLGEKTLEIIEYNLYEDKEPQSFLDHYLIKPNIKGIGDITRDSFGRGMLDFILWITNNNLTIPKLRKQQIISEDAPLKNQIIVFTGFRDEDLEKQISKLGGKVSSAISSNTTMLIVKEISTKVSTKEQKAKDMGIRIFAVQEFKEQYL